MATILFYYKRRERNISKKGKGGEGASSPIIIRKYRHFLFLFRRLKQLFCRSFPSLPFPSKTQRFVQIQAAAAAAAAAAAEWKREAARENFSVCNMGKGNVCNLGSRKRNKHGSSLAEKLGEKLRIRDGACSATLVWN